MNERRLLSLLLDYPDEELLAFGGDVTGAARALPAGRAREAILAFLADREGGAPAEIQRRYVETFDFAKRATLYLSFHAYGDRRQRGMAMLRLKYTYRTAGFELGDGTLPDHLPVILEFAAAVPEAGEQVLRDFRPGLEVIRAALHEERSPYALLLDAVCAGLPEASEQDLEDARRLALQGPPEELVGLEPFAPPEVMPPACGVAS